MDSVAGRIFSVCIFTVAFVGLYYFFFHDTLSAAVTPPQPVTVVDAFKDVDNSHTATGMVIVPSECFEIKLRTEESGSGLILLIIDSWQAPYRTCEKIPVARKFSATVFAPQTVQFEVRMDGERLPTTIIRN
jgi:hypothetical protein